jgi:hypothetical protein
VDGKTGGLAPGFDGHGAACYPPDAERYRRGAPYRAAIAGGKRRAHEADVWFAFGSTTRVTWGRLR